MKTHWLLPALVALPLLASVSTQGAAFLKFDGVDGEASDSTHPNTIEIQSFSWGMSNPSSLGGTGGGTGKASFQDFHFTMSLDKSSPLLARACASGQHIKSAKLFVRKAGGEPTDYYVITLSDILLTGISLAGDGSEGRPTQSMTLSFSQIHWSYVPVSPDGLPPEPVEAGWDVANGTSLP